MRRMLLVLFVLALGRSDISAQERKNKAALYPAKPTGWVTDAAGMLSTRDEGYIGSISQNIQERLGGDIAVVTLPTLGGYADYEMATEIGRSWGVGGMGPIGSDQRNLGVVILIVPKTATQEGVCFIAPATGAEGIITDHTAATICRDKMIPYFRNGNIVSGISWGVKAVADIMDRHINPPPPPKPIDWSAFWSAVLIIFLWASGIGFIVWAVYRVRRARREKREMIEALAVAVKNNADLKNQLLNSESKLARLRESVPGKVEDARLLGMDQAVSWVKQIMKKNSNETLGLILERIDNDGETKAEKREREAREDRERKIEQAIESAVFAFGEKIRSTKGMTREAAMTLVASIAVPTGASKAAFRKRLDGEIVAWEEEVRERAAAALRAKKKREDDAREAEEEAERARKRRDDSYSSSSPYSSGGFGSGSSSGSGGGFGGFGGGGSFSGGGGGGKW